MRVTPETIWSSNHNQSLDSVAVWNSMYSNYLLVTVWICSDARFMVPVPVRSRVIRTIAAAGSSAPYERLLADERSMFIALILHYDGEEFLLGQAPITCGGLAASQQLKKNNQVVTSTEGVLHFADENINHPDPLIQALIRASAIAKRSGKWVLAAIQNHLDGSIIPFGLFKYEAGTTVKITAVDPHYSYQNVYNPAEIYAQGIPRLPLETIARFQTDIVAYLEAHERNRAVLHQSFPNLPKHLKVQQPRWLVITQDSRPKEVRFQGLFDMPGSSFAIRVSRSLVPAELNRKIEVSHQDMATAIDQAEYPISHAVEHFEHADKPFYNFEGVYIELNSLDKSKEFANLMGNRSWMKDFLRQDESRRIIIGEDEHGIVNDNIMYFTPRGL